MKGIDKAMSEMKARRARRGAYCEAVGEYAALSIEKMQRKSEEELLRQMTEAAERPETNDDRGSSKGGGGSGDGAEAPC